MTVQLEGTTSNRMGLGAEVEVFRPGQKPLLRRAHTDGGYLGSSDPRLHFGLGKESAIAKVVVHWVGGESESWTGVLWIVF